MSLRFIILILYIYITFPSYSQVKSPEIGEKFDYTFINLINYPTKTAKVSDFKGKLLILDFWNTGCSSCVASWPKLLKLQEKFGDKIQIILVNHLQGEDMVRKTMARQKKVNNVDMTLPIVCRDTLLGNQMFPYPTVPKIAWIDQKGYFQSFTSGSYVNEEIIQSILNKEHVSMSQLQTDLGKNIYLNYNRSKLKSHQKPFFVDGNGKNSRYMPLITQSVLTGKIDGLMYLYTLSADTSTNVQTLTMHSSIRMFYKVAYNNANFDGKNKIYDRNLRPLLNNRVAWSTSGEVDYDFDYCYQLTTQTTNRTRIQNMLQCDLEKYFGLKAHLEKRKIKCLVLEAVDTLLMIETGKKQYSSKDGYYTPHTVDRFVHNLSYRDLYHNSPYPIVDETGFKGKIGGFKLSKDHQKLNRELQKCGMRFTLQEREIEVLVVTEPDNYVFPPELLYNDQPDKISWNYNDF